MWLEGHSCPWVAVRVRRTGRPSGSSDPTTPGVTPLQRCPPCYELWFFTHEALWKYNSCTIKFTLLAFTIWGFLVNLYNHHYDLILGKFYHLPQNTSHTLAISPHSSLQLQTVFEIVVICVDFPLGTLHPKRIVYYEVFFVWLLSCTITEIHPYQYWVSLLSAHPLWR